MTDGVRRQHGWIPGPCGSTLGVTWYWPERPVGPAVLLVRSFGHEDDAAGHGLHHVAHVLAAAGHPTVLLNLSGTGQSGGRLDADAPARWLDEIRAVAEHLAAQAPRGLVVGGYRAGALVALHALAGATEVAPVGYVAWHLPAGGRRLGRELRIMRAAQRTLELGTDEGDDGLVIGAHRYSSEFVDALSRLGPPPAVAAAARVLLIDTSRGGTEENPLALALGADGADVRVGSEPVDWLITGADDEVALPDDAAAACRAFLAGFPSGAWDPGALDAFHDACTTSWTDGTIHEEVRSFGDVGLSGVLTRPPTAPTDGTAVLLLSARGPGDAFVALARDQAALGRAVLRYDLSGFGWNDPRAGHPLGEIYSDAGRADVAAGVDELHSQGFEHVVVVGFCAGGWAAVRGRYSVPPAAIVAINVELFARSTRWMRRPIEADRPLLRWSRRAGQLWRRAVRQIDIVPPARQWIRRLVSGGTLVRLVYDTNDPGYVHFRSYVARSLKSSLVSGEVAVTTFPALGHLTEGPDCDAMLGYVVAVVDDVSRGSRAEQRVPVDLA